MNAGMEARLSQRLGALEQRVARIEDLIKGAVLFRPGPAEASSH